jgi:arabinose-5-phosphate isomerase
VIQSLISIPDSIQAAKQVLESTQSAIEALNRDWNEAVVASWTQHIIQRKGRLVLSGMGKSGLVAQKISATMSSTGCPSFYLHPADALHGDLGMMVAGDTALILSNSGESEEIVRLLPSLIRMDISIAAITSRPDSSLGKSANWCFTYTMPKGEGCPLNFAPMTSTTLQLVWGDLLAAYHMVESRFTIEKFSRFHPAGNIGANLLKAEALMHAEFPKVQSNMALIDVLMIMTQGKLGMTTVVDDCNFLGVISDGDIRRALQKAQVVGNNPLTLTAKDLMTTNPICIDSSTYAVETARIMEDNKITFLVVKHCERLCGVLHIHDLFAAKAICQK